MKILAKFVRKGNENVINFEVAVNQSQIGNTVTSLAGSSPICSVRKIHKLSFS